MRPLDANIDFLTSVELDRPASIPSSADLATVLNSLSTLWKEKSTLYLCVIETGALEEPLVPNDTALLPLTDDAIRVDPIDVVHPIFSFRHGFTVRPLLLPPRNLGRQSSQKTSHRSQGGTFSGLPPKYHSSSLYLLVTGFNS